MKKKLISLLTLFLILAVVAIGFTAITIESKINSIYYLVISGAGLLMILISYCSKCPVRLTDCKHLIIGSLTLLLPKRQTGPYSFFDFFITTIGCLGIILYPQFWLFKNMPLLFAFWFGSILFIIVVTLFQCKICGNSNCPNSFIHKTSAKKTV